MWQLIWTIAPDVIAVVILIIKLARIVGPTNKKNAELIVNQVVEKLEIQSVNAGTKLGLIRLIGNLMDLKQLSDAIRMASLVSLAGTLALISDPNFRDKGFLLCIVWFLLFALTSPKSSSDKEDRRLHKRKKKLWCTTFFFYISLSVLAKIIPYGLF